MAPRFPLAAAALVIVVAAVPVLAADPVAIVEDVSGPVSGVGVMDELTMGTVIHLGTGRITLGYLRSCVDEVITGGTVTIGTERSIVAGGMATRRRVECDGGRMRLSPQQAAQGGVFALRGKPTDAPGPEPDVVLYGTCPLVRLDGPGTVRIERLDQSSTPIVVTVAAGPPAVYDFADHAQILAAGGLYRATGPHAAVVFRIDAQARAANVSAIGRLLQL